jgi:4-hydroxy-3-methylbut-2-enyl diphosphate reductase
MCFGVRRAINLALHEALKQPLTILGELVHNDSVLTALRAKGVQTVAQLGEVRTPAMMISAHGASERTRNAARARGLALLESTCPLVQRVHETVARLVREGWHPVVIGRRAHPEVRGLTDDLAAFDVVQSEGDVPLLAERARFGVVAQTTEPVERARRLASLIQKRFPQAEVRFIDTVCRPTKERQSAAIELARQCDTVVVVGGARSNNTLELAETCRRFCGRVHHVQSAEELSEDWFAEGETVGLTAGTSTPDWVIEKVEQRLEELAAAKTRLSEAWHPVGGPALAHCEAVAVK